MAHYRSSSQIPLAYGPEMFSPPLGVIDFINRIGTMKEAYRLLEEMNIKIDRHAITEWKRSNKMPRYIHDVLLSIIEARPQNEATGDRVDGLEIYLNGKFTARIELPRNVEIKLLKRRINT